MKNKAHNLATYSLNSKPKYATRTLRLPFLVLLLRPGSRESRPRRGQDALDPGKAGGIEVLTTNSRLLSACP